MGMTQISISDTFDGGNIEVGAIEGDRVRLRIKPDVFTELEQKSHAQSFCFRSTVSQLSPAETKEITYVIDNASETSYPTAWKSSTVFFSKNLEDTDSWRRKLDTEYVDGKLMWTHNHSQNGSVFFSYFPPYSYNRHLDLIARCSDHAVVTSLGQTLEGREMDCVKVGTGDRTCWIIHRQHPGESMAEFFAEGLLARLLGLETNGEIDGMVKKALAQYTFYVVPSMCPDGVVMGHLRTNGAGANLNREWDDSGQYKAPSLERSPEVYHVLRKMQETGVDCFIDVHGDEELPFNFLSGAEGTKHWGPRLQSLHGVFLAAYERANSDIQREISYEPDPEGVEAAGNLATSSVANRFDCLSATLEMPFKDCISNSDPDRGWSPNRARMLGRSLIDALTHVYPYLRLEGEFWKELSAEDAYVVPTSKYE